MARFMRKSRPWQVYALVSALALGLAYRTLLLLILYGERMSQGTIFFGMLMLIVGVYFFIWAAVESAPVAPPRT